MKKISCAFNEVSTAEGVIRVFVANLLLLRKKRLPRMHEWMRSVVHSAEVNTTNDVPSLVTNLLIRNGSSFESNQVIGSEAQKKELLPRMHEWMRSVVHSDEVNTIKVVIRVFVANLLLLRKELLPRMHEWMRSVVHSDEVNTMKDVIRVFVANLLIIKERAFATNARMNEIRRAFWWGQYNERCYSCNRGSNVFLP